VAKAFVPVDISNSPDVLHLAEEVRRTKTPHLLRRDSEDIALLVPVSSASTRHTRKVRAHTKEDDEAFLRSAGGWKGNVDVDRFLADIEESRRLTRPPVEL
jgi:hypothetical protein